jgi:hypothetical protein
MTVYKADSQVSFSYGSPRLFRIACTAARRSVDCADDALVAILFAAAAIEALIFDVGQVARLPIIDADSKVFATLSSVLEELESSKASILVKIQMYFQILSGESLQKGEQPFQDLVLLIELRNELVHHKPEEIYSAVDVHIRRGKSGKFLTRLQSRGLVRYDEKQFPDRWTRIIATRVVANWACETVLDVATRISLVAKRDNAIGSSISNIVTVLASEFLQFVPTGG